MKGSIVFRDGRPVVRFQGVYKRCKNREEAERILTGLRYKYDEGTFDARDYSKSEPLGFSNLAAKWLAIRKDEVRSYPNLRSHLDRACDHFSNRNIKLISYGDLEDFLISLPEALSGKTKKNIFTTVKTFFKWCQKREYIAKVPTFPTVRYELGWRKYLDKPTQIAVLDEIKRQTFVKNPKIWWGIYMLACFPKVRPGELRQIKWEDIDLGKGEITLKHTKEGAAKKIYLLREDTDFIRSLPRGLPSMYFFMHSRPCSRTGSYLFGKDYLGEQWKRGCKSLGIEGVSIYPGTKHTSTTALRPYMSPEEIKKLVTGHRSNQAFDRYFQIDADAERAASLIVRGCNKKQGEVLQIDKTLLRRT